MKMSTPERADQVEKAIKSIQERHDIGQEILRQCGMKSPPGLIVKVAKEHDINRDTAQKLRAMVSEKTGYTQSELSELFTLFRKEGKALSMRHLTLLLSVPKGKQRDRLTREALTNKWSSHQLQTEILARQEAVKKVAASLLSSRVRCLRRG